MDNVKIKVGITQGDINGIGYEVIIKTLADSRVLDFCTPIVYGSAKVAAFHRKLANVENFNFNVISTPEEANPKRANIINCVDDEVKVEISKPTPESGQSAIVALERAASDLQQGLFDVLVTAPINKKNIQNDSFHFAGHTEYLEQKLGGGQKGMMVMCSDVLRVAVATGHVPQRDVYRYINIDNIVERLHIFNKSLKQDFCIQRPRIAVLGLNPHAGDNGLLGTEEQDAIIPAVRRANEEGIMAFGPFPTDDFFGAGSFKSFDGVLAMYHDQGLVPFKCLSMDCGVNFTAGLPIIRTSPVHGTAYDKAGIGQASPDSFRAALYMACDIFKCRKNYKELTANRLQRQNPDSYNPPRSHRHFDGEGRRGRRDNRGGDDVMTDEVVDSEISDIPLT